MVSINPSLGCMSCCQQYIACSFSCSSPDTVDGGNYLTNSHCTENIKGLYFFDKLVGVVDTFLSCSRLLGCPVLCCPRDWTLLCLSSGLSGHFSVTGGLAVVVCDDLPVYLGTWENTYVFVRENTAAVAKKTVTTIAELSQAAPTICHARKRYAESVGSRGEAGQCAGTCCPNKV